MKREPYGTWRKMWLDSKISGLGWLSALVLVFAMVLFSGCGGQTETRTLEEGQYYTYYVNSSGTALVSRIYEPEATDTEAIIAEFLEQCQTVPEGSDGRRAIPTNVVLSAPAELEDGIANLYFDTTYTTMDKVTELLCKAAMAKTITQLDGVDYIRIFVNGEVYTGNNNFSASTDENDEDDINLPGARENNPGNTNLSGLIPTATTEKTLWSGSDFLDNTGDDTNKYVTAELLLYFAAADGKALVEETREVVYSSSLSLERVVLNQLIEGPQSADLTATLPKNLKIQGVSLRDGVCYVDFDSTFLEEPVNVTDQVEIYSIVNSLTELNNVTQVQITVNGSADAMLRNNISLSGRFEKDLNLVAVPEETVTETTEHIPETTEEPTQQETSETTEEPTQRETSDTTIESSQEETPDTTIESSQEETSDTTIQPS